jgi:hypothetical protein
MLGKNGGSDNRVELKGAIERQIMERTWRRVHDLQVRITKRGVVVSGRTGTYHVKQVAIQAVLDLLASSPTTAVAVDIQVVPSDPLVDRMHESRQQ